MNKYFPVGVGSFKELAATSGERQYYFVDKTRFISDFWNSHEKALLITRPRRFGKTLLLDMCKCFFDINGREKNKLLFENLSVAKEHPEFFNKYFGRYPVIFLTLKTIKAKTYEEALDAVHERIIRLIKTEFLYLLESKILSKLEVEDLRDFLTNPLNENKLKNSLLFLSGLLEKHHGQKTIILLDEYDSPIHDAFSVSPSENRYHEVLLNFMSSFIGQTFKDNPYLERGIITGILHISHNNMFSGPNNIPSYTLMDDKYVQDFGFTEEEIVEQLIQPSGSRVEIAAIRDWYNGYQFGESNIALYNPWSIVRCLSENGKLDNYWVASGEHGVIGEAILRHKRETVLEDFQKLLLGKNITKSIDTRMLFTDIQEDETSLWSLLVFSGYLKVVGHVEDPVFSRRKQYNLAVPNEETMFVFSSIVDNWFRKDLRFAYSNELQESLITGDVITFQKELSGYMNQTMSCLDFEKYDLERVYHVFIAGLLNSLRKVYALDSNKEVGSGRYDFKMIPLNQVQAKQLGLYGIIIEFKSLDKPPEGQRLSDDERRKKIDGLSVVGLKQIHDKKYVSALEQHGVEKVLLVSLAFSGKEFSMLYEKYEQMDYEKYRERLLSKNNTSQASISAGSLMVSGGIFAHPENRLKRARLDDSVPILGVGNKK